MATLYCGCNRQGIYGLVTLVQQNFTFNPFMTSPFLFCGRRRCRTTAMYCEGNGFILAYKLLNVHGR